MINSANNHGLIIFIYIAEIQTFEDRSSTWKLNDKWESAEQRAALKCYEAGIPQLQNEHEAGLVTAQSCEQVVHQ